MVRVDVPFTDGWMYAYIASPVTTGPPIRTSSFQYQSDPSGPSLVVASTQTVNPFCGDIPPSVQQMMSLPSDVTEMDPADPGVPLWGMLSSPRSIILFTQISSPVEASRAYTYPS